MTGKGIVIKTNNNSATVRIKKSSSCGHNCGECRICKNPEYDTAVINNIGANPGDTVIIGISSAKILLMAFILYILPLLGAIIVFAVTEMIFSNTITTTLFVSIWIVLWFLYIRFYNKHQVKSSEILEVVNEKN